MNTHFCFSERLILREKRFADFPLGHWSTKKKLQVFKNIEKKRPYRRVAQKKAQFCTRRRKSHFFFDKPCMYIYCCNYILYTCIYILFDLYIVHLHMHVILSVYCSPTYEYLCIYIQ